MRPSVASVASVASVELLRTLLSAETARRQRATRLADVLMHDVLMHQDIMHQDICYIQPVHEKYGQFDNSYAQQKVIFLVRDPRDAIVSRYHQHKDEIAKKLGTQSLDSYVCQGDDLAAYIQFYNDWHTHRDRAKALLVARYEDMKLNTFQMIERITDFLELSIPSTEINSLTTLPFGTCAIWK